MPGGMVVANASGLFNSTNVEDRRSSSSSFSDLGEIMDDSITSSTVFSPIHENLTCNEIELIAGEAIRSKVENTAYLIYYSTLNENTFLSTKMDAAGHTMNTTDAPSVDMTRSIGRGLFRASTSVGNGILKGATGLVSQTYQGGSSGGFLGFAKGLGMGVLGFGTHTVKGAFRGVGQVTNVVGEVILGANPHLSLVGTILLTNYRILWMSSTIEDIISIPIASIASAEYCASAPNVLNIVCKSLLRPHFAFPDETLCYDFLTSLLDLYAIPYTFAHIYAMSTSTIEEQTEEQAAAEEEEATEEVMDGKRLDFAYEEIYNAERDYTRLNLMGEHSNMQTIDNTNWEMFPTYPKQFILPKGLETREIEELASYRSARRIPAVVWRHPITKATMCRCAQPCVGLSGSIVHSDQKIVELLSPGTSFHFIDARSQIAATANVANGKGTEDIRNYSNAQLHHCDIANIHAVRSCFENLALYCQPGQSRDNEKWKEQIESTLWLENIDLILKAVVNCCEFLQQGDSIMIHCSDGWDRTPQLTALTQLVLDPYYRSLHGMIELIEKEWCSFGHMFRTRYSQYEGPGEQESEEQSPVFIQWLDCVWQLWREFPTSFEFNELFLIDLYHHVFSCLYGTFLYNSEKERFEWEEELQVKTKSIWPMILNEKLRYINTQYDSNSMEELKLVFTVQLWPVHITMADPICHKYHNN